MHTFNDKMKESPSTTAKIVLTDEKNGEKKTALKL